MRYLVCYRVKYSEEWCADECSWVEHSMVVKASTPHRARKAFREYAASRRRFILGDHIDTRRCSDKLDYDLMGYGK